MLTDKLHHELELLQRHILVLSTVNTHQPIGIMKLSEIIDLPPHKVRYSLRLLEQSGYIGPSTHGAIVLPEGNEFLDVLPREISLLSEDLDSIRSNFD